MKTAEQIAQEMEKHKSIDKTNVMYDETWEDYMRGRKMTREEAKSCIGTIEMLQRLAYNIHGVMDVIDADNCKKIIKALEQEPVIEIKVGDEVTVAGVNGIVVQEPYPVGTDSEMFVLIWYGQHMSSNSLKNVAPTGRHFPQITEVLEQLKESY